VEQLRQELRGRSRGRWRFSLRGPRSTRHALHKSCGWVWSTCAKGGRRSLKLSSNWDMDSVVMVVDIPLGSLGNRIACCKQCSAPPYLPTYLLGT
jgi:hypothetical protein